MKTYTQKELNKRNNIIQTQKLFINFLDKNITNRLVDLFDGEGEHTIIKYIDEERRKRGLDISNVSFKSYAYGEKKDNSTLIFYNKEK